MLDWNDAKRAGQSVYMSTGRGFQDMYVGISHAYQQILMTGHVSPILGNRDINQEIAEDAYQPIEADRQEYSREQDNPDLRLTGPEPDAPDLG